MIEKKFTQDCDDDEWDIVKTPKRSRPERESERNVRKCEDSEILQCTALILAEPPPKPHFEWNHSRPDLSDDMLPATFRSMEFWESSITATAVDVNAFNIDRMVGVELIAKIFLENVAKPCLFPDVYAVTLNNARALNFALVGPSGNGKRTAAKRASAMINTSGVVIAPHNYVPGNLSLAFDCAALWRPFVVYVDDFDILCSNERFVDEYTKICRGPFVAEGCSRVWIILAMSSVPDQSTRELVNMACAKSNLVEIPPVDSERLVKMLFEDLAERRIKVSPDSLTEDRWMQLRSAIVGVSVRDVNEFAVSIAAKALKLVSVSILASRCSSRSASARSISEQERSKSRSGPSTPQKTTPIPLPPPLRGDASVATSGIVVPIPDASAAVKCVDEEQAARTDGMITIDWSDVESMYCVEEGTLTNGWVHRVSIPKSN